MRRLILISGAAGKNGLAVIRALARDGHPVRAFVYRENYVSGVLEAGADEVVVGSMQDPAAYQRAADGVRAVYHIPPNMHPVEIEIGQAAIQAARAAGIEHFVYHSVLHPHIKAMPHHWHKACVEEMLFASGLAYTILQPAVYMQNLLAQQKVITGEGTYTVPYPVNTALGYVDLRDVAEVARIVLTADGCEQGIYELCGEGRVTQSQIAHQLSASLGQPVRARELSLDAWRQSETAQQLNSYARESLAAMFAYYAAHGMTGNSKVLGWLLGRPPTGFDAFVEREFSNF